MDDARLTALPKYPAGRDPEDVQRVVKPKDHKNSKDSKDDNGQRILTYDEDDPRKPTNWSGKKKAFIVFAGTLSVINSTFGSSLPSNAEEFIAKRFSVTNEQQLVLPVSCYLMGYVVGPPLCGPVSENYGRKRIFVVTFFLYTIFTMACAVAPSWWSLLFFRFLCGLSASAPIAVVGGIYADIFDEPRKRGMAMALFMAATAVGPVIAPFISGFIAENVDWRWVFAVGTLFALITLPMIVFIPETYDKVLLSRRAARIRERTGEDVVAQSDLDKKSLGYLLTVVMTLPYRMLVQELIVACVCAYTSIAYAIFYLNFESYPLIFMGPESVYKWSPGLAGLAFLPIGLGALLAIPISLFWDKRLEQARQGNAAWAKQEEYRRLPLACIGGPLFAASLFWIGWSARSDVHWIAPVLSGIFFGLGFILIFIALLNYLSDAYETFAASAMGIASTCRSLFGALLPLAARRMFTKLGIDWGASLLGFVCLAMSAIPFVFIEYGDTIRANSKFCRQLREMKKKQAKENDKDEDDSSDDKPKPKSKSKSRSKSRSKSESRSKSKPKPKPRSSSRSRSKSTTEKHKPKGKGR